VSVEPKTGGTRDHLLRGIELFNERAFFEAHEQMEEAMNSCEEDDNVADWEFYLGLLRAAVAHHKLTQGESSSAVFHLKAALDYLAPYPDRHHGLKLREFRCALAAELARLTARREPRGGEVVLPPPPRIEMAV
jgi:predicted metal-dependent hydrolase